MDWKAIMNKLPEDLQYEVTTFIPSKTVKITNVFVKWYKDKNPDKEFLGIRMDPKFSLTGKNLGIELSGRINNSGKVERQNWIVGREDNMRQECISFLGYLLDCPSCDPEDYHDNTWDKWVSGSFVVDGTPYYVARDGFDKWN